MAKRRDSEVEKGTNLIFDEEAIKKRRIIVGSSPSVESPWICKYCSRRLISESVFMRHECETMIRSREMLSAIGKRAFLLYSHWLKKKTNNSASQSAFMNSSYYRGFIKFSNFVDKVKIAHPLKYVELMIEAGDMHPSSWSYDVAYSIYNKWVFDIMDPGEAAIKTIEYLNRMCEICNKQPSELLDFMGPAEIINSVRMKKIAPWVLIKLPTFQLVYEKFDHGEISALEAEMDLDKVVEIIESNQSIVDSLLELCAMTGY